MKTAQRQGTQEEPGAGEGARQDEVKARGGSRGKKERDPQHGTKGTEEDQEDDKEEPTLRPNNK